MAFKSVIDIDVNDEKFADFYKLYEEFERSLGDMPEEWKKLGDAIGGAGKEIGGISKDTAVLLGGMRASSESIVKAFGEATKAQRHFDSATRHSARSMGMLEKSAAKVSKSIFGIGKTVLKWGAIGGGLAGLGAGVGLDDLAYGALSRQRSARGLGMTPGQHAAFSTYFNQFGNADSVASNIANARNDVTKRWIFSGMGIGPKALATDSNFQLDILAEKKAQRLVKSMPRGEWQNISQALGLTSIFSEQQLRLMRHTSYGRVNAAAKGATVSVGALGFSPKVAKEWSNLSVQLRKAGIEIETSLIKGLHRIAPEMSVLSKDITKGINAFMTGPQMKTMMAEAEYGLKRFANFITSPSFEKTLVQFEKNIGTTASEMAAIAKGILPYAKAAGWVAGKSVDAAGAVAHGAKVGFHGLEDAYRWTRREVYGPRNNPGNLRHKNKFGGWVLNRYATPHAGMEAMARNLMGYPSKHHADTLASIIPIWNGHGKNDPNYISFVSHQTRYKPDQPLNLNNQTVRDKVMAAMIGFEQGRNKMPTPDQVADTLNGNGLSASVNRLVNTLRRQQAHKPAHVTIRNQTAARIAVQTNAATY